MRGGGKKDEPYICEQMLSSMQVIDPDICLIDLVTFDGASNVQKAARLMKIHYPIPTVTVSPAIEHTVSLIFNRVMRLHPIPIVKLCDIAKRVRNCVCKIF